MAITYPKEIHEQEAVVKRELDKLAKMRNDHLIKTGQMPKSYGRIKAKAAADRARMALRAEQQTEMEAQ